MTARCRLLPLFAVLAMAGVRGAELVLPPITGELSGDFTPLKLPGAPTLHWTLTLENPAPLERIARIVADGTGTHLKAEAKLDAAGNGTWRLLEGEIELKEWLGGRLLAGTAAIAGEGTVKNGDGFGELTLSVRGLDLAELMRIADAEKKYVQSAQGKAEGTVHVMLNAGEVSRGAIALRISEGTKALILFQPSPGLLSNYVPALVRLKYNGIVPIELGQTPLEANVLSLAYTPTADAAGRRAIIHIEGRPLDRKYTAPLELDFNFLQKVEWVVDNFLKLQVKISGAK